METLAVTLHYLAVAAVAAVVGALVLGFISMAAGGAVNERWGNRLMRLRVVLQGGAVALLAGLAAVTVGQN
jgi:hypothetical protein